MNNSYRVNGLGEQIEQYLKNIRENSKEVESICNCTYLEDPVSYSMSATAHFFGYSKMFATVSNFHQFLLSDQLETYNIAIETSDMSNNIKLEDLSSIDDYNRYIFSDGYIYSKYNHGPLVNLKKIYKQDEPDNKQVARFLKSLNLYIATQAFNDPQSPILLGLNLGAGELPSLKEDLTPIKNKLGKTAQSSFEGIDILKRFKFNNTKIIDAYKIKKFASCNYFSHSWLEKIDTELILIGPSHFKGCKVKNSNLIYIPAPNLASVEATLGYFFGIYNSLVTNKNININKKYTFFVQSAAASLPIMYLLKKYLFFNSNFIDFGRILDLSISRFHKRLTAFNLNTFDSNSFFLQELYKTKCGCIGCV
jgi:hypothetical protein